MKNIKVNYTDAKNNRTSTTINGQICWAYFKQTNSYKYNTGDKDTLIQEIQKFVNTIKVSNGAIDKGLIEDLMLNHIMSTEFERGMKMILRS